MKNSRQQALPGRLILRNRLTGLAALCLSLCAQLASGASIEGRATNVDGEPLYKVAICLAQAGTAGKCDKVRWTDKKGNYSFAGLKPGGDYTILVNGDRSAANRKNESYSNYVWEPTAHTAAINSLNEKVAVEDFVGKFNFSNFQRIVALGTADFPELASIDLDGSYTALKVFIPSSQEGVPPETIFLGQVHSGASLEIEASVPLSVTNIGYEIYSAVLSISGSIVLR
jgi:hypothetical protein